MYEKFKLHDDLHLIVLDRILRYIKFYCKDEDLNPEIIFSPGLKELFDITNNLMREYFNERNIQYKEDWGLINEQNPQALDIILKRAQDLGFWNTLSLEEKTSEIKLAIYPYSIDDDVLTSLLEQ